MSLEFVRMLWPFGFVVLIVFIGCAAGVLTTIAKQIRKYTCHRQELEFKRELLDRGLSVAEIERLVRLHAPATADESYAKSERPTIAAPTQ